VKRSWRAPRPAVLDCAEELADEVLLREPDDIDVRYVAAALGSVLLHAPLERGEGTTLRAPGGSVLTVDARLEGTPLGRFIGMHEVGHVVLHPDIGLSTWCRGASGSFFQREIDASDFGSRALTPSPLVRAWLPSMAASRKVRPTLSLVRSFAETFRVPLPLALLRLVDELGAPVAVVQTRGGVVRWWSTSDDFPFPITMRFAVGRGACARSIEALARHEAHGEAEPVAAGAWSKHKRARGARVSEQSVRLADERADDAITLLSLVE
jgi:hypothetical protein